MTQPLTMYTTPWCAFCRRLKSQLARDGIEMFEVDIPPALWKDLKAQGLLHEGAPSP